MGFFRGDRVIFVNDAAQYVSKHLLTTNIKNYIYSLDNIICGDKMVESTTNTTKAHKIDITFMDGTTIKNIREMMNYCIPSETYLDLDDELVFTLYFTDLDDFLGFWGAFGKYIKTVWDYTEKGPKFHNYV